MIAKYAPVAAGAALLALLVWHPARPPVVQSLVTAQQSPMPTDRALRRRPGGVATGSEADVVVYVAGAVRHPGLYHLHAGDRDAKAIELAGGFTLGADTVGVNLAQRASDGDEIAVPILGEAPRRHAPSRAARHRMPPVQSSVDVNRSDERELAAVPGIGRAIAQRIVELRTRQGPFASLDELLDVAGVTQSRLERARPYLRQP